MLQFSSTQILRVPEISRCTALNPQLISWAPTFFSWDTSLPGYRQLHPNPHKRKSLPFQSRKRKFSPVNCLLVKSAREEKTSGKQSSSLDMLPSKTCISEWRQLRPLRGSCHGSCQCHREPSCRSPFQRHYCDWSSREQPCTVTPLSRLFLLHQVSNLSFDA